MLKASKRLIPLHSIKFIYEREYMWNQVWRIQWELQQETSLNFSLVSSGATLTSTRKLRFNVRILNFDDYLLLDWWTLLSQETFTTPDTMYVNSSSSGSNSSCSSSAAKPGYLHHTRYYMYVNTKQSLDADDAARMKDLQKDRIYWDGPNLLIWCQKIKSMVTMLQIMQGSEYE